MPVALTVATRLLLLAHVPPAGVADSSDVEPTQRPVLPVTGDMAFTVITFVTTQAPPNEYVMVVVPPAPEVDELHTVPSPSTVAVEVLLLVQLPPVMASLSVMKPPEHSDETPVIGPGAAFTVMTNEDVHPPNV
jgi:hypothetical protein